MPFWLKYLPDCFGRQQLSANTIIEVQAATTARTNDDARATVEPHHIQELRLKLSNKLHFLRTNGKLGTDRKTKNRNFYELYETISKLMSKDHYAGFESRYEGLIIASIEPTDPLNDKKDSWHVLIEDSIAIYLDVKGQFSKPNDQFSNTETLTTCNGNLTIRTASFNKISRLVLSKPQESCGQTQNIIYGIRCKRCSSDAITFNISYVGQVSQGKKAGSNTVHKKVCTNHQAAVWRNPLKPMYSHVKGHSSTFRDTMEVIYLPTGDIVNQVHLNSWECFWHFFCRARECRGGWCEKSENKDVKIVNSKGKMIGFE